MSKPRILIFMDGGIIQGIVTDADVDIRVIDYDVEDDEGNVTPIPQFGEDRTEDAVIFEPGIEVDAPATEAYFNLGVTDRE